MIEQFRFLLAEDQEWSAQQRWVNANLHGLTNHGTLDLATSFSEGWHKCHSIKYDGMILDMHLSIGNRKDLPAMLPALRYASGKWLLQGGLYLWAEAVKEHGFMPPTIFFTGRGHQVGAFITPLQEAGLVFYWGRKDPGDALRGGTAERTGRSDDEALRDHLIGNVGEVFRYLTGGTIGALPSDKANLLAALLGRALGINILQAEIDSVNRFLSDRDLGLSCEDVMKARLAPQESGAAAPDPALADADPRPMFEKFMESVRKTRIDRGRRFPTLVHALDMLETKDKWDKLRNKQDGGWNFESLFLEFDFTSDEQVPPEKKRVMYAELALRRSALRVLDAIFSRTGGPLVDLVHPPSDSREYQVWDPRKIIETHRNRYMELLDMLDTDDRRDVEMVVEGVRNAGSAEAARSLVNELVASNRVREPCPPCSAEGQPQLYLNQSRRQTIAQALERFKHNWTGQSLGLSWRADIAASATNARGVKGLRDGIDARLRDGSGSLCAVATTCRGYFQPVLTVFNIREKSAFARDLSQPDGTWQPSVFDEPLVSEKGASIPVRLHLDPLWFANK